MSLSHFGFNIFLNSMNDWNKCFLRVRCFVEKWCPSSTKWCSCTWVPMLPSAVWKMGRQTQPRLIAIFSGFLETAFSEDRSWPVPCGELLPWRGVTPGLGTQHQSCSGCCGCCDCSASFPGCLLTPGTRRQLWHGRSWRNGLCHVGDPWPPGLQVSLMLCLGLTKVKTVVILCVSVGGRVQR